mmetsp:Transcript_46441/g.132391  ORF Transcript_46441/g.132391 Transcript_46441/m.132391 type:complete len:84 (+) Transcript_46441:299-550(+)
MTTTWSALATVLIRCAITREVRPAMTCSKASCSSRSVWESRALVASSRSRTGAPFRIVRAMATRCFWPPDRDWPYLPTSVSMP